MDVINLPPARWTWVDAVQIQAAQQGGREFLAFDDGQRLTFAELDAASDAIAVALAGLGVEPGDRVLALAGNSKAFILAMVGTHKRRAVFAPVNTELKGAFLEHQVRNSSPRVILVDEDLLGAFEHVDVAGVGLEHVIVVGSPSSATASAGGPDHPAAIRRRFDVTPLPALPPALVGARGHLWADLLAEDTVRAAATSGGGQPAAVLRPEPSDVCTIMYTSGTTGPSKGVLMPQAHCFLFAHGFVRAVGLTDADRFFTCMPFFHANALLMQVFPCLLAGAQATVARRFSVTSWLDDVIACEATITNALGVMPEFIYRQPPTARDRDHHLTRIMALPIAEEWGAAFEARFGVRLIQGYGMTEVNMVTYSDPADPVMAGCAGRVLDEFFEVVVADPATDQPLPAGEAGEILVRPRRPFCFNVGYNAMAEKTVEAWRNLWFHTGDAGRFDDDGRLFFVDRLNDRIRRRGENISSYEIEQVLNEHPAVLESAAVGVRVEGAGGEEEIKACLVLAPEVDGGSFVPTDLLDWCRPRMPRYAVPRFVEVVTELDKTPSGKVRKQALRQAGITAATWDREAAGYQLPR